MGLTTVTRRTPLAALALLVLLLGSAATARAQSTAETGRLSPWPSISIGAVAVAAEGDPAFGAYIDWRAPIRDQWLAGVEMEAHYQLEEAAEQGSPAQDAAVFALAAVATEFELAGHLRLGSTTSLRAGGRLGAAWEQAISPGSRGELYALLGLRAAAARAVGPRLSVEARVAVDLVPAMSAGVGIGLRLGAPARARSSAARP